MRFAAVVLLALVLPILVTPSATAIPDKAHHDEWTIQAVVEGTGCIRIRFTQSICATGSIFLQEHKDQVWFCKNFTETTHQIQVQGDVTGYLTESQWGDYAVAEYRGLAFPARFAVDMTPMQAISMSLKYNETTESGGALVNVNITGTLDQFSWSWSGSGVGTYIHDVYDQDTSICSG